MRVDETGDHLLVESSNLGKLPEQATSKSVVLQIYSRGVLRREVTLGELFPNSTSLDQAVKLGVWATRLESPESGTARYGLASGQVIRVNLASSAVTPE